MWTCWLSLLQSSMFYVFGKKITLPKAQPKSAIGFVNVTCAARLYQHQHTSLLMLFYFILNIFDPRACCFFLNEDMGNPISEAYNLTAISFSWAYISQTISVTRNSILDDSPGAQCLCTLLHHSMTQNEWSLPASGKPHSNANLITSLSSTRPSSILFLPSTKQNNGQYGGRTRDLFTSNRFDQLPNDTKRNI